MCKSVAIGLPIRIGLDRRCGKTTSEEPIQNQGCADKLLKEFGCNQGVGDEVRCRMMNQEKVLRCLADG